MWVGASDIRSEINKKFSKAKFYPVLDAVRGVDVLEEFKIELAPLDPPFLREFSSVQIDTLKMMDRLNAISTFDYAGRERLYYRLLAFWKAVLDKESPDLVVFATIPHMIFDYIIYGLCRRSGIRTAMFESTPMRGLVFIMETFDSESQAEVLYQKLLEDGVPETISLRSETKAYLDALRGSYDQVPVYMRRAYNEELPGRKSTLTITSAIQKLFEFQNYQKMIEKQLGIIYSRIRPPANYLVQKRKKPEHSKMSRWEYSRFRKRAQHYMRNVEAGYDCLTTTVNLEKPYIYVALSYQPERTSSPMAGIFVNQHLMVNLLSKSLPDGWWVYVKEHPTQFTPSVNFRAQSGRTLDYYDDLALLPNVGLVPMPVSSFDLTDNAQAIATITGSVGWEAVNRGKPVLLFGHPWYRGCEGTFKINSVQDCFKAIQRIEAGYKVDLNKLHLFVHAIEEVGIDGFVEPHLRVADISDHENAKLLGKALQNLWDSGASH